jgi:hypothetical protein
MNTLPKLFDHFSWDGIMTLSSGEQIELAMFGLVAVLWIAGLVYGGYLMFRKKGRQAQD